MDFNQEGDQFATAGRDHCIRIYDTETLKVLSICATGRVIRGDIPTVFSASVPTSCQSHPTQRLLPAVSSLAYVNRHLGFFA